MTIKSEQTEMQSVRKRFVISMLWGAISVLIFWMVFRSKTLAAVGVVFGLYWSIICAIVDIRGLRRADFSEANARTMRMIAITPVLVGMPFLVYFLQR